MARKTLDEIRAEGVRRDRFAAALQNQQLSDSYLGNGKTYVDANLPDPVSLIKKFIGKHKTVIDNYIWSLKIPDKNIKDYKVTSIMEGKGETLNLLWNQLQTDPASFINSGEDKISQMIAILDMMYDKDKRNVYKLRELNPDQLGKPQVDLEKIRMAVCASQPAWMADARNLLTNLNPMIDSYVAELRSFKKDPSLSPAFKQRANDIYCMWKNLTSDPKAFFANNRSMASLLKALDESVQFSNPMRSADVAKLADARAQLQQMQNTIANSKAIIRA